MTPLFQQTNSYKVWLCSMIQGMRYPFNLVPVTSTTIQMVFRVTMAIALMEARNLTKEEYVANHPDGKIDKSLIFKMKDLMKNHDELPISKESYLITNQLMELMSKGCGCLLVIDESHHLIGTFTDGDLCRTLRARREAIFKLTVGEMCNRNLRIIGPEAKAVEAMKKMEAPPKLKIQRVIYNCSFLFSFFGK